MLTKLLVDNVLVSNLAFVKYVNNIIHSDIGLNNIIKECD